MANLTSSYHNEIECENFASVTDFNVLCRYDVEANFRLVINFTKITFNL